MSAACYVPPLCPGADPGADWQEMGWCCRTCAVISHLAWCPSHPGPPGPDAWACQRCGGGWFGTPPEDGLCGPCRAAYPSIPTRACQAASGALSATEPLF